VIGEILKLREESARLLGYATFAAYRLEDSMAKTPQNVRNLLERVWKPARTRAMADRDAMQALVAEEGANFKFAAWDWRHYAEKLRQRRANFDDSAIKPYLTLDGMIAAAFDTAHHLFGLSFTERKDIPVWHPDVRVWQVKGHDGRDVGLFYGDYFARASKRSGAWMTSTRDQQKLDGAVTPLILNVCNFSKGADGEPALLSPDDARTLFHEFGHGLHGLCSNVVYPSLSGTSVFTDFVELPSQLYEHWQEQPQVLRRNIWLIGTIGSAAPFIGLFGTVVGIMRAFHHMAQTGTGGFAVVASGISEALVATALGLGVAIIAVALYNYFQVRLNDLGTTMRVGITRFIDGVCAFRGERGTRQVA
jgi:peptidyl-dipeptidase Dcp